MTLTTTQIEQTKPIYQPVIKVSVGALTGALVNLTSDPALSAHDYLYGSRYPKGRIVRDRRGVRSVILNN